MRDFDRNLARRHRLADLYRKSLSGLEDRGLRLLAGGDTADWLFMVLVNHRDEFAESLKKAGIETNLAHIRNDLFKVFGGERWPLPCMAVVEPQYLCLPMNDRISFSEVREVCRVVKESLE